MRRSKKEVGNNFFSFCDPNLDFFCGEYVPWPHFFSKKLQAHKKPKTVEFLGNSLRESKNEGQNSDLNHGCLRASLAEAVIRFVGLKSRSLFNRSHIGSSSLVESHPCCTYICNILFILGFVDHHIYTCVSYENRVGGRERVS